ncbi:MAG TPA: hypothetical protein PLR99_05085 [Polyangiaceae bacterium]|nr:hypothetical protein [Polyangiaceae bacterium]
MRTRPPPDPTRLTDGARALALVLPLVLASACGDLKVGQDVDGGSDAGAQPPPSDGGGADAGLDVRVDALATGRSRVGARSTAGFKPWRGGLAVRGDRVYWVESGAQPGLYGVPVEPCASPATCAERLAPLTRPSAFATSQDHAVVADVTTIKRFAFADAASGKSETVASHTEEIVNLATEAGAGPAKVFWTAGTDGAIRFTTVGGTTSTPIHSNGTPVATAVAAGRLFWAGVDLSGQTGALQSIGTNGTGAREVSRFQGGLSAMGGNGTYLYYAKGLPSEIHRVTVSSGRDETLDREALGVTDFALDDTYATWTEPGDAPDYANGRVRRIAHDSTTPEVLAVSVPLPVAVAVDGARVVVASAGTRAAAYADGKILRLTLTR